MIKVGIAGADDPLAGELLRLLMIHPEVELKELVAPSVKGQPVSSIHKGFIGEQELRFCEKLNAEDIDILFSYKTSEPQSMESSCLPEGLKVVICTPFDDSLLNTDGWVPGVSELYRKPLVRGAMKAFLLPSPVVISLIVLFPLAVHLLLNDTLKLQVGLPKMSYGKLSEKDVSQSVENLLKKVQLSFSGLNGFHFYETVYRRAVKVEVGLHTNISIDEIKKMYEDIYDDHNFSFVSDSIPDAAEVEGTQKCLIYISKPSDDRLMVIGLADGVMRGGAGDALHVMNLLFGLFEKIGLNLPASNAFNLY